MLLERPKAREARERQLQHGQGPMDAVPGHPSIGHVDAVRVHGHPQHPLRIRPMHHAHGGHMEIELSFTTEAGQHAVHADREPGYPESMAMDLPSTHVVEHAGLQPALGKQHHHHSHPLRRPWPRNRNS